MSAILYHNARCSHSRVVLDIMQTSLKKLTIIDYQKTPPTIQELKALAERAGLTSIRMWMREKDELYRTLQLKTANEEALYQALAQYPQLLNRPIVCTEKGVALCRPVEKIYDLL